MSNFTCSKCGKLEYVLFDGYPFGDRTLEGVKFRCYETGKVEIDPKFDDSYWQDLNTKKWLKEAKEYGEDLDVGNCPTCHAQIAVAPYEETL